MHCYGTPNLCGQIETDFAFTPPDLSGFVEPVVDLSMPDLRPMQVPGIGASCDGGAPAPLSCMDGKTCSATRGPCATRDDCCLWRDSLCALDNNTYQWRCCAGLPGMACTIDADCCYRPGHGVRAICSANVCI